MKDVILSGGLGTRISEETHLKPKPMIEIGRYSFVAGGGLRTAVETNLYESMLPVIREI
jgi:dTDP-glucose pyrophosphorylase